MIIQKLRQIKSYCEKHEDCENCIYKMDDEDWGCAVGKATDELTRHPHYWDLELVEKLLNGVD